MQGGVVSLLLFKVIFLKHHVHVSETLFLPNSDCLRPGQILTRLITVWSSAHWLLRNSLTFRVPHRLLVIAALALLVVLDLYADYGRTFSSERQLGLPLHKLLKPIGFHVIQLLSEVITASSVDLS